MSDSPDLERWSGLGEEVRRAVTVSALRGLLARGLLDPRAGWVPSGEPSGGMIEVPADPGLTLVLLARRQPSLMLLATALDEPQPGALRLYLLSPDEEVEAGSRPWAVLERLHDSGLHAFSLCTVAAAVRQLAEWATASSEAASSDRERLIEVLRPGHAQERRARLRVVRTEEQLTVEQQEGLAEGAGAPETTTAVELEDRLDDLIARCLA